MAEPLDPRPGIDIGPADPGRDFEDNVDTQIAGGDWTPTFVIRGFRVYTTAGNIKVKTLAGVDRVLHAIQLYETTNPVQVVKVYKIGTTAVGIEAF